MGAVLAGGARSFLSHTPSGQLAGIVDRRDRTALHVSVTGRTHLKIPGIVVHRPRTFDPIDTTRFRGIRATTATRTVWDIASTSPSSPTRRAFRQAEKLKLLNRPRLGQLLEASPNRKGAGVIVELLASRTLPLAETRSWLEDLLVTIIVHGRAGYLVRRYSSLAMTDETAVAGKVLAILRERTEAP